MQIIGCFAVFHTQNLSALKNHSIFCQKDFLWLLSNQGTAPHHQAKLKIPFDITLLLVFILMHSEHQRKMMSGHLIYACIQSDKQDFLKITGENLIV